MKNYLKICILLVVIMLGLSGCQICSKSGRIKANLEIGLKNEDKLNYPNLKVVMLDANQGVFYQENNPKQIKFNLNSSSLICCDTKISVESVPTITFVEEKVFIFSRQVPQLNFDKLGLVDLLLNPEKGQKKINVVVIDAGHGGKDPGAVGKKYYEKNINLAVAFELKKQLEQAGKTVYLTREIDDYISLKDRVEKVDTFDQKADLFISIHQNSSASNTAVGIETYLPTKILNSELMSENDKYNFLFACQVQQNLAKNTSLMNRGVKHANFYVIKNTKIPAILIECGFISNEVEEEIINSEKHRNAVVNSIVDAILCGDITPLQ